MCYKTLSFTMRRTLVVTIVLAMLTATALAQHERAFPFNFANGSNPQGGLIADSAGNLYGTTCSGGSTGGGTVYEMSPPVPPDTKWTETVIYSFGAGRLDGFCPAGDLVFDRAGNLYGTNSRGGGHRFRYGLRALTSLPDRRSMERDHPLPVWF